MENRYKIILSGKGFYKEIDISPEISNITVGTEAECAVRLRKEYFFEGIVLSFIKNGEHWSLICSDNLYIAEGAKKLLTKQLRHGDAFMIHYQQSSAEVFNVFFALNFDYEKKDYNYCIDITNMQSIQIGGKRDSNIFLRSPYVGSGSLTLSRDGTGFILADNDTQYGVYCNGNRIKGKIRIKDNDFISLADFSFCLKGNTLLTTRNPNMEITGMHAYDVLNSMSEHEYPKFNRNTRIQSIIPTEGIQILDPPAKPQKSKKNIILSLLPAIGMLAVTVLLRGVMSGSGGSYIIMSVATMSIGLFTTIFSMIDESSNYKKDIKKRVEDYNNYIELKEEQIQTLQNEELELLDEKYYSLGREVKFVEDFSSNLFNRVPEDKDFLELRLGKGKVKANRAIDYKKQESIVLDDELALIPEEIANRYEYIDNVPVVLDLKGKNAVGIVGDRAYLQGYIKTLVIDLTTRHYYDDLRLFLITNESRKEQFNWIRFVPHIQNEMLNMRNIVCDTESKTVLFEYLYKEINERMSSGYNIPHIVVLVYDDEGLKQHPISKYIPEAAKLGITFLFFNEHSEFLPTGCSDIVTIQSDCEGVTVSASDYTQYSNFTYETVSDAVAEMISNKLAPVYCEEVSLESTLTKSITFFEMLNIVNVDDVNLKENWDKAQISKTMAAPLGVKAGNETVYLDLHEKAHGPHGLVAGTTGSGKSEILQSYILSMAMLYHPYEVGFVIIDFKGGGMCNQFRDLPHLVGAITNIDGREIDRSLKSIKAELQKRQRVFAEAGVNNISNYILKYKAGEVSVPIPHLIIIVDEFAELKAEQPEFMKELISAARIGRSLGVHLILATQKPSGQVNEQIWSNSRFKLCLKVQNAQDSNEVIKSPLAAEIKEPGRAYLQVGNNEVFDLFQSAYSGAPSDFSDDNNVKEFDICEVSFNGKRKPIYQQRKEKKEDVVLHTQLDTIVEYVKRFCETEKIARLPAICLPALPEVIDFPDSYEKRSSTSITVPIGIYDDPDSQYQGQYSLNITTGNTLIIGSSQMGKTNVLQILIRALAEQYSPDELSMYVIDFGSMILKNFETMAHVGGVVTPSEDEALKNLFKILISEIAKRKEKMLEIGVSSFLSYKEAGKKDIPQILLLIDNFTALKELYLQDDDVFQNICRDGIAVGISVVVANTNTNGIGYRYLSNFSSRIAFFCNDSSEYSSVFDYCKIRPADIAGRGIIEIDKNQYECQTFLAFKGEREIDRVNEMRAFAQKVNEHYAGRNSVVEIPVIPKVLTKEMLNIRFPMPLKPYHLIVGLDYSTVEPVIMDVTQLGLIAISGRDGMGRSNMIRYMLKALEENKNNAPVSVCIVDNFEQKLSELQELEIVSEYTLSADTVLRTINQWDDELKNRYELLNAGKVEILQEAPLLLLIIHNSDIATEISNDRDCLQRYKNFFTKYKAMKVAVIYSNLENANIPYGAPEAIKPLRESHHFMFFDDLARMKLCDVPLSTTKQYRKEVTAGDCYLVTETGIRKIKTVLCDEV